PCRSGGASVEGETRRASVRAVAKVTIIGAGSVEFTRGIVADLCSYEDLGGTLEIALHDIDPERLAYSERTATALVEQMGAGHRVSAHADRGPDRKSTRLNSSHLGISYAVFCLKKKKKKT